MSKKTDNKTKKELESVILDLSSRLALSELKGLNQPIQNLVRIVDKAANNSASHYKKYGALERLVLEQKITEAIAKTYTVFFFDGLRAIGLDPIEELKKQQKGTNE